ncbi:hypothetical protein [Luteimonas huabeiensis]|uniref:hypothetical protein n=1 Tax=Luteimonas huabeiensis TaxID=1244513 RepID=UPI00046338A8|nr:hypothetical protein [Luteimonas huabeiensis]
MKAKSLVLLVSILAPCQGFGAPPASASSQAAPHGERHVARSLTLPDGQRVQIKHVVLDGGSFLVRPRDQEPATLDALRAYCRDSVGASLIEDAQIIVDQGVIPALPCGVTSQRGGGG